MNNHASHRSLHIFNGFVESLNELLARITARTSGLLRMMGDYLARWYTGAISEEDTLRSEIEEEFARWSSGAIGEEDTLWPEIEDDFTRWSSGAISEADTLQPEIEDDSTCWSSGAITDEDILQWQIEEDLMTSDRSDDGSSDGPLMIEDYMEVDFGDEDFGDLDFGEADRSDNGYEITVGEHVWALEQAMDLQYTDHWYTSQYITEWDYGGLFYELTFIADVVFLYDALNEYDVRINSVIVDLEDHGVLMTELHFTRVQPQEEM